MKGIRVMKSRGLIIALAVSMVALLPFAAHALSFDITVPNSALSDPSKSPPPFGTVTISLTNDTTASISYTVDMTEEGQNDLYSIIQKPAFAINVNATAFTVSGLTYGPGTTAGAVVYIGATGNDSQFGSFNAGFDGPPFKSDAGAVDVDYLSFILHNTSGTWANAAAVLIPNNKTYVAGVHVAIDDDDNPNFGLTGFAGAHNVNNVPVPPAVYLLGSGLLGLVGLHWRRARKEG
jgi:hypothetical protein